jgi:hypothetical protein
MKAVPFVLVAIMAFMAPVRSQVMDAATIREPVAPVASPTTACILGDLPDGTPPPPQPPKPTFVVAAKDILTTATQQQGGRTITINYWRTERPAPAKGGAK